MKRTALKLTIAAAAMLASAGLLSAESMKAEIPFPFYVGNAKLLPGAYEVHLDSNVGSVRMVQVSNVESRRSVLAVPGVTGPHTSATLIVFACTEGKCELTGLKGIGSVDYGFRRSKNGPATRIAEVVLKPDRAD